MFIYRGLVYVLALVPGGCLVEGDAPYPKASAHLPERDAAVDAGADAAPTEPPEAAAASVDLEQPPAAGTPR